MSVARFLSPGVAAWALGAIVALGLAGSVYHIPIQVSDSLETIRNGVAPATIGTAFVTSVRRYDDKLRPLGEVRSRLLVTGAETLGLSYHLLFRGYHALAGAALVLLLVGALPARRWTDVSAVGFALAVLVGMHTFAGMFREAFPVNHFLLISVYALATFVLSGTRGGRLIDLAAVLLLAAGLLTLESGVLIWVVAVAAHLGGRRGISRTGLLAMTAVLVAYGLVRVVALDIGSPALGGYVTGWGTLQLTPDEQVARFGDSPLPLYTYNVITSALSVLASQPSAGQWTVAVAWMQERLTPVYLVEIGSSLATTALIAWYALTRTDDGRRGWQGAALLTFLLVLVANAGLSLSYAKNEIIGPAGVFYALAAGVALQGLLARPGRWAASPLVAAVLIAASVGWAVRDAGLHFKLANSAFRARAEWSTIGLPGAEATEPDARMDRLVARMKAEALARRATPPGRLPRWGERWWGEE